MNEPSPMEKAGEDERGRTCQCLSAKAVRCPLPSI